MNFVMCTRTNKYYSTSILIPYEQGLKKASLCAEHSTSAECG